MPKGTVKWFNNPMKYGFIVSEEGKEIFVHFSEIMTEGYKTLKRGDFVEFEIEETTRGIKAVHVTKIASGKKKENSENSGNDMRRSA